MIRVEKEIAWINLEEQIRGVRLLNQTDEAPPIYPYENSQITLRKFSYAEVAPTSLYVLRENLALQAEIAKDIADYGLHPLELGGGVVLIDQKNNSHKLIPPIVEETFSEGKYVLDGAHRTSIGRWLGRTHFIGILISSIDPAYPAYALPNAWDEIKIYEKTPEDLRMKKNYRSLNYRKLYRDFSHINGSTPRT